MGGGGGADGGIDCDGALPRPAAASASFRADEAARADVDAMLITLVKDSVLRCFCHSCRAPLPIAAHRLKKAKNKPRCKQPKSVKFIRKWERLVARRGDAAPRSIPLRGFPMRRLTRCAWNVPVGALAYPLKFEGKLRGFLSFSPVGNLGKLNSNVIFLLFLFPATEIRWQEWSKGGVAYEVILADPVTVTPPRKPGSPKGTPKSTSAEDIEEKLKAAEGRRMVRGPLRFDLDDVLEECLVLGRYFFIWKLCDIFTVLRS